MGNPTVVFEQTETAPDGTQTTYYFFSNGASETVTQNPNNGDVTTTYTYQGNTTTTTQSDGNTTTTYDYSNGNWETVSQNGQTGDVTTTQYNASSGQETIAYTDPSAGTTTTQTVNPSQQCFCVGTLIQTPQGEVPVESLKRGDSVVISDGSVRTIRWLGVQTVSRTFCDPIRAFPIRIAAGALAEGLPKRDLRVSPAHALLIDGVLVEAGALVNGSTIVRTDEVSENFEYYHIELAEHAMLLAEGVEAESFVDNVVRMHFDNWQEHEALEDAAPVTELDLPRAQSSRQVPSAVKQRLSHRAAVLIGRRAA